MKVVFRLIIAAIGAAAFASCTQNGGLIYSNIQKTQKTNTSSSIPLDITVSDIVNVGSGSTPYYVAAGKIYNGSAPVNGTTTWGAIPAASNPNSGTTMLCNALTYSGTLLYGGFFDGSGSGYFGLFTMPPGGSSWSQVTDSLITDGGANDKQITYVTAINGDVFAVAATLQSGSYVYEVDVFSGGTWTPLANNIQKPVTGIGWMTGVPGTYFVTSGSNLYKVPAGSPIGTPAALSWNPIMSGTPIPSSPIIATDGSNSGKDILQGVYIDSSPIIIIPAANPQVNPPTGNLYYSTDGTNWTHLSQTVGGYNVGFLSVSSPLSTTAPYTYLLGTDSGTGGAFGFYAFVPSTNTLNRFGGLSYSLYYSAIRRILVDLPHSFVAMGTINNGLWATVPVDPTGSFGGSTWTQE